jgi:hypothetical protein
MVGGLRVYGATIRDEPARSRWCGRRRGAVRRVVHLKDLGSVRIESGRLERERSLVGSERLTDVGEHAIQWILLGGC